MRPYLAVLKDAFREALSSWLLVIVLIIATILLLGLAGFGLSETALVTIAPQDFFDPEKTSQQLLQAGAAQEHTPARRVWELLPENVQTTLKTKSAEGPGGGPRRRRQLPDLLTKQFNILLNDKEFYREEYWKSAALSAETQKLIDQGPLQLSRTDVTRLNRRLLDSAFPYQIRAAGEPQPQFMYYWLNLGNVPGVEPKQMVSGIVAPAMRLFIGMGGLIIAILVTSTTIPQMYEPGAIDLLLSKPVSRVLLFLTRFLGGCIFVLVVSAYLVTGIWLLCGLRLGIWFPRMLGCIPLFVFLFIIYYTVSALAGVIWRNAIVAVLLTALFMGACMGLETYRLIIETAFFDQTRIVRLIDAGDTLLAAERNGTVLEAADSGTFTTVPFHQQRPDQPPQPGGFFYPYAGPQYDRRGDRLVALQTDSQFGQFGGSGKLVLGPRDEGWAGTATVQSDQLVTNLFCRPDGTIITVGMGGVSRLDGDPHAKQAPPLKLFGGALDLSKFKAVENGAARWVPIGPANMNWIGPMSAALNADGRLAVVDREHVTVLKPGAEDRYVVQRQVKREKNDPALVAIAGDTVAVVPAKGEVQLLDAQTLAVRKQLSMFSDQKPKQADLSADGRWLCVLTHEHFVHLCDTQSGETVRLPITGQGDVSAIAFTAKSLLVADFYRRVTAYEPGTWTYKQRYNPGFSTWEAVNFYVVFPMYDVLPKPGDLSSRWTAYFMNEPKSEAVDGRGDDLTTTRITNDLWTPLWSNAAFVVLMLTIGSLYVWRKDF